MSARQIGESYKCNLCGNDASVTKVGYWCSFPLGGSDLGDTGKEQTDPRGVAERGTAGEWFSPGRQHDLCNSPLVLGKSLRSSR